MKDHLKGIDFSDIVVDSDLTREEALRQNSDSFCPQEIIDQQEVMSVHHFSFDKKIHRGQLVIHQRLIGDIEILFRALLKYRFPLASVIPVADPKFHWDDELSMAANNSSGFNYRTIAGTKRLSLHAFGQAIDLNPLLNPHMRENVVTPSDAVYDIKRIGTIDRSSFIVQLLENLGWEWGGRWTDRKDYQHFQKPLN